MSLFMQVLLSNHISIIQILIVAYIGALIGEIQKEIDDDEKVKLLGFCVSWLSSGFIGTMAGMMLQGTVAKDNSYLVLGGSGVAGFMGRKKALTIIQKMIIDAVNNMGDGSDDKGGKTKK
jgi:hypothetical protein